MALLCRLKSAGALFSVPKDEWHFFTLFLLTFADDITIFNVTEHSVTKPYDL